MPIRWIERCDDFLDGNRPAIVQIGATAPNFDERRRVETILRLVGLADGANVMEPLIGEGRAFMAICATHCLTGKKLFAPPGGGRERAAPMPAA